MGTSSDSRDSMRGEVAGGSLPFVLAAGAAVVAFVLTRAFLDWNEDHTFYRPFAADLGRNPWASVQMETAYILLLPAAAALTGIWRRSMQTALLVAFSAAAPMAFVFGDHYASPLEYDNAGSLVAAVFMRMALQAFALGMLLPLGAVVGWLWKSGPRR